MEKWLSSRVDDGGEPRSRLLILELALKGRVLIERLDSRFWYCGVLEASDGMICCGSIRSLG